MSDTAAILRDVYGPNAAKKIARRFGVAVVTAKVWLAGRFPETRTRELAAVVAAELDRIDERNKQIRERLGIGNGDEPTGAGGEVVGSADSGRVVADIGQSVLVGTAADGLGDEVADT